MSKEPEESLMKATENLTGALLKMTTDRSEAKWEIAYGTLSTNHISQLFKLARNITWPILGLRTVTGIINEIISGVIPIDTITRTTEETAVLVKDVQKGLTVLQGSCQELNYLCQEGIEHILCTLGLGKYSKPSISGRLFKKSRFPTLDDESGHDIGTDAFITRFDLGLEKFMELRKQNLTQFYDATQDRTSQSLFIVLSTETFLFGVAQKIRELILFVDKLRADGSITHKRFVYPDMKTFRKVFPRVFHSRRAEDLPCEEYGGEEGDVYAKVSTYRSNRISSHYY